MEAPSLHRSGFGGRMGAFGAGEAPCVLRLTTPRVVAQDEAIFFVPSEMVLSLSRPRSGRVEGRMLPAVGRSLHPSRLVHVPEEDHRRHQDALQVLAEGGRDQELAAGDI